MLVDSDDLRDWLWLCDLADQCDTSYQTGGRSAAMDCVRRAISTEALHRALKSSHAMIRRRAVYLASLMPQVEAIASLSEVLIGDECPVVRHEAAFCLGAFNCRRSIDFLTKAMLHDPDALVRHEAAEAVGDMGTEEARQALCVARRDPCEAVQRTAVIALQELDLPSVRNDPTRERNVD